MPQPRTLSNQPIHRLVAEDVIDGTDGVTWARSCDGPVTNIDSDNLKCYGCDEPLSFVKEHQRRVNGIQRPVCAHYKHRPGRGTHCSSETLTHKAAKHALCTHKSKWKFYYPCSMCKCEIDVQVADATSTFQEEVQWGQYRIDVGIAHDGIVDGAIEVLVTHKSEPDKLDSFTERGLSWCEVHAHRILNAIQDKTFKVEVAECADTICHSCIQKEKKRVYDKLDADLTRESCNAERVKKQRKRIIEDATKSWQSMTATDSHDTTQQEWIQFTQCVLHTVSSTAKKMGIRESDAQDHAESILDGEIVLKFGKHKGRTLEYVEQEDWPYLLWLAGYNWGKMDDRCRAEKRNPGHGSNCITKDVEEDAKNRINGLCFECQNEIENFHIHDYKTWCRRCYVKVRQSN